MARDKHQTVKSLLSSIAFIFAVISHVSCGNLFVNPTPGVNNVITASIESSFVISCVSTGSEEDRPKALQWRSPSNRVITADSNQRVYTILNGDTLRLFFDNLLPSDAGTYTCVGVEAGVPREVRVDLILQKRITFENTLQEQLIRSGMDMIVNCKASANPGPEIAWFRKGISVELKNDHKYQMTNEGLMIKNAQVEDEGVYYCQASVTATGEVKRIEINVQVMTEPKWVIEPKDTEGVRDQDVVIKCEAFAKPAPKYTWLRNGIALGGTKFQMLGGTLTIRNLIREDSGTYTCVAENNSGKIVASLKLHVLIGPEIARIDDQNVIEGNLGVLRCNVREAYPKATIRWKYADTQEFINTQDPQGRFLIKNDVNDDKNEPGVLVGSWSELHILRTSRLDKRNYTCVAVNRAAEVQRTAQLLVEYAPKLILNNEAREIYYSWMIADEYGNSGNTAGHVTRAYPVKFTCFADGEPKPLITWYFKGLMIRYDNMKYRLLRDSPGVSELEVNPKLLSDFGDYQCRAENRHGKEERNIQLREATPPRFEPLIKIRGINPESVVFDLHAADAPQADGGLPIEAYKIRWRPIGAEWVKPNEKEVPLDLTNLDLLTSPSRDVFNVEIPSLVPDTDYLFSAAAVNKPGTGVWSTQELKVRTMPRRQPDPVKMQSQEECQESTKCYVEWIVDSNGGSPIRDYMIRWRRISYKDATNQHVNTDKIEPWSDPQIVKAPATNYQIMQLFPNSFYEVDIIARNDIGQSASQPFRIRTSAAPQVNEAEAFELDQRTSFRLNRAIIIAGSIIGAILLFLVIDVICLIKSNCGLLASLRRLFYEDKSNSNDYKQKTPLPKIAQHQPKSSASGSDNRSTSKGQYEPVETDEPRDATNQQEVHIPIKE